MTRATATISGYPVAETDDVVHVEGNIYFPATSIKSAVTLERSDTHTTCPWKGVASYYNIRVDDQEVKDAAWFYPEPKTDKAEVVRDRIAFYASKVEVKET